MSQLVKAPVDLKQYLKQVVYILNGQEKNNGFLITITNQTSPEQQVYCVSVAHYFNNSSIYINVCIPNVNGSGVDKIVKFQLIGYERNTDIALLKYYADLNNGFLLNPVYYSEPNFVNQDFEVSYNDELYALSNIKNFGGVNIQRLLVKDSNFNGDSKIILPTNVLLEGRILKESGGAPVLNNQGKLVGMITQEVDTDFIALVKNKVIDTQVFNFDQSWIVFTGQFPNANITEIGNFLKRSGSYSFVGMKYEQYDINDANDAYYLSMENFRSKLADPELRKFGGYLIQDFVHGYNNVENQLVYNPFQPIYTGFKIDNPMKNTNLYSIFYKYEKKPVIWLSIEFYNGYLAFLDFIQNIPAPPKPPQNFYVKDYLGKYYEQGSIFNFLTFGAFFDVIEVYIFGVPLFDATKLPIIIEYLWNDGEEWHYEKEEVMPFKVTYTNENNRPVEQYSLENPYPLYGIDSLVQHFKYL